MAQEDENKAYPMGTLSAYGEKHLRSTFPQCHSPAPPHFVMVRKCCGTVSWYKAYSTRNPFAIKWMIAYLFDEPFSHKNKTKQEINLTKHS